MIPFNKPPYVAEEEGYVLEAIRSDKLCGDGPFTEKCQRWMEINFNTPLALLTPSCTASLEMAAILIGLKPGDEVIMPSYTFVSTANAFVLRGAKIIFVDIRPDTMNIDEKKIEAAINKNTKAIVPVHYAGVSCEMDPIMELAEQYGLWVIEDAAQGVMSTYKGNALGTIGHIGCFSFHETKNYTAGGEGGAILINDESLMEKAQIVREKGTDRKAFLDGQVDKYTWRDVGSSFLPSELQAAYLYAQFKNANCINDRRMKIWNEYSSHLSCIKEFKTSTIPRECQHNAHMYYIKLENIETRVKFIEHMKRNGIVTPFHYLPLHSCSAGMKYSNFFGKDSFTTQESNKLVRLPLYYNMSDKDVSFIISKCLEFSC